MMPQFPSRRSLKAILIIVWSWPTFPGCFASSRHHFQKCASKTGESDKVVLKDERRQAYGGGGGGRTGREEGGHTSKANPAEKMKRERKDAGMKIIIPCVSFRLYFLSSANSSSLKPPFLKEKADSCKALAPNNYFFHTFVSSRKIVIIKHSALTCVHALINQTLIQR